MDHVNKVDCEVYTTGEVAVDYLAMFFEDKIKADGLWKMVEKKKG
jgi:hypothetical protein